ncbi:hypothetical protein LXL04_022013 [Taraxacum kok-saghyz]
MSKAASKLMEDVHGGCVFGCSTSYEAVIPVKLERQLDVINQVVLIHNDCLYLSREILGLAFELNRDVNRAEEYYFRATMADHVRRKK